jgi:hypothetical protein
LKAYSTIKDERKLLKKIIAYAGLFFYSLKHAGHSVLVRPAPLICQRHLLTIVKLQVHRLFNFGKNAVF